LAKTKLTPIETINAIKCKGNPIIMHYREEKGLGAKWLEESLKKKGANLYGP